MVADASASGVVSVSGGPVNDGASVAGGADGLAAALTGATFWSAGVVVGRIEMG